MNILCTFEAICQTFYNVMEKRNEKRQLRRFVMLDHDLMGSKNRSTLVKMTVVPVYIYLAQVAGSRFC